MPVTVMKEIVDLGKRITGAIDAIGDTILDIKKAKETKEPSDVNFYDWDGSIVESYTAADFLKLTKMPDNPVRDGWDSRGWNWSFEDAQQYVGKYGALEIGQMYNPLNVGPESVITINIPKDGRMTVPFCWQQATDNSVTVWFSDEVGSEGHTYEQTEGLVKTSHTFPGPGEYTITILPEEGSEFGFGDENNYTNFLNESFSSNNKIYASYITNIIIGRSLTEITKYAFSNCFCLKQLIIPDSVENIKQYAFYECHSLKEFTIPDSVTNIGTYAFNNCYILKDLIIPNSISNISGRAFQNCFGIQKISVPNSVVSIGVYAFYSCFFLKKLILPDSCTEIGDRAFSNSYAIEELVVPDSITTLGSAAFGGLSALKKLYISNSITTISSIAFYGCNLITEIVIPESVTSIEATAFNACYSLLKLVILPETPPTLANINAFQFIPSDCIIYVPYSEDHSILNAYKTATNWSTFADQMVESDPV